LDMDGWRQCERSIWQNYATYESPNATGLSANSTDTPGGSNYSSTWTDLNGNLWLLTGNGFTSATPHFQPSRISSTSFVGYLLGRACKLRRRLRQLLDVSSTSQSPTVHSSSTLGSSYLDRSCTGNLGLFGGQDSNLAFLKRSVEYNIGTNDWTPTWARRRATSREFNRRQGVAFGVAHLARRKLGLAYRLMLLAHSGCSGDLAATRQGLMFQQVVERPLEISGRPMDLGQRR